MAYQVEYHKMVSGDVRRALRYYEKKGRPGAADHFFEDLVRTVRRAAENPLIPRLRVDGPRRLNFETFKHHIVYIIVGEAIYVRTVQHSARHPDPSPESWTGVNVSLAG